MIAFAKGAPTMAELNANVLTDREVRVIAARAFARQGVLETMFNRAVFGPGHDPNRTPWADWPQHARDAWDRAVWYYRLMKDEGVDPSKPTPRGGPSLIDTWNAVLEASPSGSAWHELPNVTWPKLSPILGIGARSVHYYMVKVHGWRFRGRGSSRRVAYAPCASCGTPTAPPDLIGLHCPSCFDQTVASAPR